MVYVDDDDDADFVVDDAVPPGGEKSELQENVSADFDALELHQYASQLSSLAERDIRVERLLSELFQLMNSDDDDE